MAGWSIDSIPKNYPLISSLVALAVAQSTKFFISWYKERRWDFNQFLGIGGMPSSHSAIVSALATAVGLQEGFGGALFAASLILACIVTYDATGMRLHTGRQAEVLNQIVYELPASHPLAETRPLRELLGQTPPQALAGSLLGIITSVNYVITLTSSRSRSLCTSKYRFHENSDSLLLIAARKSCKLQICGHDLNPETAVHRTNIFFNQTSLLPNLM